MSWTPPDGSRGNASAVRVTASDAENRSQGHCELHLNLKARPNLQLPGAIPRRSPYRGPLFRVAEVIEAVHRMEAVGVDRAEAMRRAQLQLNGLHAGDRVYAEHALEQYFDFHDAREAELGAMTHLGNWNVVPQGKAELGAWAPVYETSAGMREIRRFRLDHARRRDTEWADIAAMVALGVTSKIAPVSVHVVEIGLLDGMETVVVDGATPAEIQDRYVRRGRAAANAVAMGEARIPGWDCKECKAYATCGALLPVPGALQQSGRAAWTRSVSASDLNRYETCPAQWHMKDEHLPVEEEGNEARFRGTAVHAWLEQAHKRRVPCQLADLADPGADDLGLVEGLVERDDYRAAYPYLKRHIEACALAAPGVQVVSVEETQYCLDEISDVVVVIKPDMIFTRDNTLVIHEVKTTQQPQLPEDADAVRDQYLAVALNLVALEAGLASRLGCARGEMQLEIITSEGARTYTYELTDDILMAIVRERVRTAVIGWAHDSTWEPVTGAHCTWCPVRRWCPARDAHESASSGNLGGQSGDGDLPPF